MKTYRQAAKELEREYGPLLDARDTGRDLDRLREEYADDPVAFSEDVLGVELWSRQEEILRAVADENRVVSLGCNASGKDFALACAVLWWAYAVGGLAAVTSSTERQVREVNFGEIRSLFRNAKGLPGQLYATALWIDRDARNGILGFTSSEASRTSGLHHDRLLICLSEAQGIERPVWGGLLSNAAGAGNTVLAVANPLQPEGMIYEVARSADWTLVRMPASEHPNVVQGEEVIPGGISTEFVEQTARLYGKDSSYYVARVEARFPESSEDALVSVEDVEAANRHHERGSWKRSSRKKGLVVGFDPARFGGDESCMAVRKGPRIRELRTWGQLDTMKSVGRLIDEINKLDDLDVTVVIDEPGLGGPILDRLKEARRNRPGLRELIGRVVAYHGGKSARKRSRFKNRRAETYFTLRQELEEGNLALPKDSKLREELTRLRWHVGSDGKVRLESKDDLRSRIGRSPDRADAVVMTLCRDARRTGDVTAFIPM